MLCEHAQYSQDDGKLAVSGYVRGAPLSADRLVHIPGLGDFQVNINCRLQGVLVS